MEIFEYSDYKSFVKSTIQSRPKAGRGQYRKMAEALGVTSVLISQIFSGPKDLTIEQAHDLTQFFGLSNLEKKYFLLLVQKERAGTHGLKQFIDQQLEEILEQSLAVRSQFENIKELTEEQKATFYSSWIYSATRLMTAAEEPVEVETICQVLGQPREKIVEVIQFLLDSGLCKMEEGQVKIGPHQTHVGRDSKFLIQHLRNWRIKALEKIEDINEQDELSYSGPMMLSERAAKEVRKNLLSFIRESTNSALHSEAETLYCLNLDWIKI